MVIVLKPRGSYLIGRFYSNRLGHLKLTKHTKSYLIAWTRNVSCLNLKYPKSVTISCDWSILALVTDCAWCERRIRILPSTKVLFFFSSVQLLSLLWQLKVSIDLLWEKWKMAISTVTFGIMEFYFYRND